MLNEKRIAWLEKRKTLLTASDIGAVLGLSPFKSNVSVYLDKISPVVNEKSAAHLIFGHAIEKALAEYYAFQTGHIVTDPGDYAIAVHPDIHWIGATLDRLYQVDVTDDLKPLELKSVGSYDADIDSWTESPPLYNQIQGQTQCAVTRATEGRLVGLFPGYRMAINDFKFDADFWNRVLPALDEFWNYNVKKRIKPTLIPHANGLQDIKRLYPKGNGATVVLDEHLLTITNDWEDAKTRHRESKKTKDNAESTLREALGDASFGTLPDKTYLIAKNEKGNKQTLRRKRF